MAAGASAVALLLGLQILCVLVAGEDPYRFFTWNVTYGNIYPLGVKQQVSSCILLCYPLLLCKKSAATVVESHSVERLNGARLSCHCCVVNRC
jgi:hypothetical protein